MNEFINYLKSNEWNVELYETPLTDEEVKSALPRYPFVSGKYLEFLKNVKCCINKDETMWFNCCQDFCQSFDEKNSKFYWNEFEMISLSRLGEDDEEGQKIKSFWDKHLPIIMSAAGEYYYYALQNDGKIVRGYEPEFEETEVIADSFKDFIVSNIITYDDIKDDKEFWLFFLACEFSQGYDEDTEITMMEFIEENYEPDMEWSDEFTGYYDGVLDERDGYIDMPKRLKLPLATGSYFYIDFHPGDTLFYIDDKPIGSAGPHFQLGAVSWENFKQYTDNLSYGEKLLILPMLNAENADIGELKTLVTECLKATPIKEEDLEMCCKMIISVNAIL